MTEPDGSLLLGAFAAPGDRREVRLVAGKGSGAKLREGTYLLSLAKNIPQAVGPEAVGDRSASAGDTPHLLLTIESV